MFPSRQVSFLADNVEYGWEINSWLSLRAGLSSETVDREDQLVQYRAEYDAYY